MRLREWGWTEQKFIEREYPDELIADFVGWLLETHAWQEDTGLVLRRFQRLKLALANHRQTLVERPSVPPSVPSAPVDDKKARQLAQLAKAREARKAKLAARAVQHQEP